MVQYDRIVAHILLGTESTESRLAVRGISEPPVIVSLKYPLSTVAIIIVILLGSH